MENRTALRGARISKGLVVLFAVIVAIGLGVMAAFVAKSVSGPAAATQSNLVQSTYRGPGPDAREHSNPAGPLQYADDKPSTGHGFLP
jgi:hypothetical protein